MFHNYFCVIFNQVAQITFSFQLPARGWEVVQKFRNQGVGCFHFSWFPDLSTAINISWLALNKPLSYLQTSFTSQNSADSSPIHVFFQGEGTDGGRYQYWRLVYLRFLRERWTYLVPCVAPSDWKVEANCDSFQVTSACSLLLTGLGVCSALSRHTASVPPAYFSPCLHFAIKPSKHCSAICKYSWKHPICSRSKLLPVLILCGMVSKLTDGAVSSICSVNSSGEDGAWMGYFSPLSSQQKAAPIYLLL